MNRLKHRLSIAGAIAAMILLIIDTETAKSGVTEGLTLCMKVIIPSLFPFFIITTYLNSAMLGIKIPGLHTIGRILHTPSGSESILLLGLLGGYPVGAQLISEMYRQGYIDRRTAQILLGYCSNAGPSFIFGITPVLFTSSWIPFLLWGIHLLSAILTGILLPRPRQTSFVKLKAVKISLVQALKKSIPICASVCGWIIVFKTILAYLSRWQFISLGEIPLVLISGVLELSNGCLNLAEIPSESIRFVICAIFLAFGGICVMLQTMSVTEPLGLGLYVPGKIMQTCISLILALLFHYVLFPEISQSVGCTVILIMISVLIIIALKWYTEKSCGKLEVIHV